MAADLNGDHHLDLVAANGTTISVLLGNGDGTFQPAVNYAAGNAPIDFVIGDFNGDGIPDLAVDNYGQTQYGNVQILIGNGDGTFKPATIVSDGNNYPLWITAGDFNGDGKFDLAVLNRGSASVGILFGKGDGTFQPLQAGPSVGTNPFFIWAADLSGDGKIDLIVSYGEKTNNVNIYLGNGNGTFQTAQVYTVGQAPGAAVVADFNGDGLPDIAIANGGYLETSGGATLLTGTGGGAFRVGPTVSAGENPGLIITADFNGDGKPDLALTNSAADNLTILLNITP